MPTPIVTRLSDVAPRYRALFCDLWGCVHDGYRPFPEAVAALTAYRRTGGIVMLLTNSPRPKPNVIRQLDKIGVPREAYDDVTSSGDAAQAALAAGVVGRRVFHLGPPVDLGFFRDMADDIKGAEDIELVPLEEAEGIVCTGLFDDENETPDDYRAMLLYAKTKGLKLLCANPDIVVDRGAKRVYCAGALARLYTEIGGESLYFGKPHPPIYDLARRRLRSIAAIDDAQILCIGDGIGTDIAGGIAEGLDTMFITGGLDADAFGPDPDHPDPALLDAYLARHKLSPTYAIPRLR